MPDWEEAVLADDEEVEGEAEPKPLRPADGDKEEDCFLFFLEFLDFVLAIWRMIA